MIRADREWPWWGLAVAAALALHAGSMVLALAAPDRPEPEALNETEFLLEFVPLVGGAPLDATLAEITEAGRAEAMRAARASTLAPQPAPATPAAAAPQPAPDLPRPDQMPPVEPAFVEPAPIQPTPAQTADTEAAAPVAATPATPATAVAPPPPAARPEPVAPTLPAAQPDAVAPTPARPEAVATTPTAAQPAKVEPAPAPAQPDALPLAPVRAAREAAVAPTPVGPAAAIAAQDRVAPQITAQSIIAQAAEPVAASADPTTPDPAPAPAARPAPQTATALAPLRPASAAPPPPAAQAERLRPAPQRQAALDAPTTRIGAAPIERAETIPAAPPRAAALAAQSPSRSAAAAAVSPLPTAPVPERALIPERPAAATAPLAQIERTARDTYNQSLDFLQGLPKDRCFVALPSLVGGNRMALEVFGPNSARLAEFSTAMRAELGTVSGATERIVTQAQCRALEFIRDLPSYPAFRSYIQLDERIVTRGIPLRGRILGTGGRFVHLVAIDNTGSVQTLDAFLLLDGGGARFLVPMYLSGREVVTWQLLLAISADAPVRRILQMTAPVEAGRFFTNLTNDLQRAGARADVALMAFSVR